MPGWSWRAWRMAAITSTGTRTGRTQKLGNPMTMTEGLSRRDRGDRHAQADLGGVRDPVCGMAVDPATAKHRSEHAGHPYYFCSSRCRGRFDADPARYLTPAASKPARTPVGEVLWTCPMHPQIRRPGPGSCPICGMALEPMSPSAGDGANPELRDMTRRFWVCVALSLPLVALVMGEHFVEHALLTPRAAVWVQLFLATPA